MMFARAEGRGFHLPGGDGLIVMIAGGWAALLIFYRVLDHPDPSDNGATIGIQWGVFVAFLAAAFLVYAGVRIRVAHRPEPPLPAADGDGSGAPRPPRPARRRPADADGEGGDVWRAVDPDDAGEAPTRRREPSPRTPPPSEAATDIVPRRRRPPPPPADPDDASIPGQLSFDEAETRRRSE
jgi:hypothetical protein